MFVAESNTLAVALVVTASINALNLRLLDSCTLLLPLCSPLVTIAQLAL